MALFGDKPVNTVELARAQVRCEMLEQEVSRLRAQVEKLQDALVAATAPKAYDAMQVDKWAMSETVDPEREKRREEEKLLKMHLENIEKPTFYDADDLVSSLSQIVGINPGSDGVPGNSES